MEQPRRPSQASAIMLKNAVYYPSYRVYRGETPGTEQHFDLPQNKTYLYVFPNKHLLTPPLASMNYNCISHVFYAFAHLAPDGGVFVGPSFYHRSQTDAHQLSDEWADAQMRVDGATGCLGSFMRLKEQHEHLQLILSIGGGAASHNFASVASTAPTRDNFGRSAKGLVDASNFDGIDSSYPFRCLVSIGFPLLRRGNNILKLTGNIPPTLNKAATSSLSSQPCVSIFPITATSSPPRYVHLHK